MGAAIFEQRRHDGLGGLLSLQFPPLVVFPNGKFTALVLAEETLLQGSPHGGRSLSCR